jgi:hypothetical protein
VTLDSAEVPLEVDENDVVPFLVLNRDLSDSGFATVHGIALKRVGEDSGTFMRVGYVWLSYQKPERISQREEGSIEIWDLWLADVLKVSEKTITLV